MSPQPLEEDEVEYFHPNDFCFLCQRLLYDPIVTPCGHMLCKPCMVDNALGSLPSPVWVVAVHEDPTNTLPVDRLLRRLSARCPVCCNQFKDGVRTCVEKCADLRAKYPAAYAARADAQSRTEAGSGGDSEVERITMCVGNENWEIQPPPGSSKTEKIHEWSFFAKFSRHDIIEGVTFAVLERGTTTVRQPPYQIYGRDRSTVIVMASVTLKDGYIWESEHAVDSLDGGYKRMVLVEWLMAWDDFGGKGCMG
ncbi:hypothetical protein PG993_011756 [Apiospora rasikravindrae]|uniref:RING-type domain-containing protein n=1 Tax=Apiospora rasikravindrae TaxID=990691 RepID=A0ABR1S1Y7_9PEZI